MLYETKYNGYLVDELGNVWSTKKKGGQGSSCPPRIHSYKVDKYGYQQVCLSVNGSRKYKSIHRLVYESINGDIPYNLQVDHINNDKTDNRICNLQLLSLAENVRKANLGKEPWQKGKPHANRNLYELYINDNFIGIFDKKELKLQFDITNYDVECNSNKLKKKGYTLNRV